MSAKRRKNDDEIKATCHSLLLYYPALCQRLNFPDLHTPTCALYHHESIIQKLVIEQKQFTPSISASLLRTTTVSHIGDPVPQFVFGFINDHELLDRSQCKFKDRFGWSHGGKFHWHEKRNALFSVP